MIDVNLNFDSCSFLQANICGDWLIPLSIMNVEVEVEEQNSLFPWQARDQIL